MQSSYSVAAEQAQRSMPSVLGEEQVYSFS